jgi:hypothetical protein
MGGSALTDPAQATSLATLVGLGDTHKPFECVGDPDECAVALSEIVKNGTYDDCTWFGEISRRAGADRTLSELLEPQGSNRVPTHWHR